MGFLVLKESEKEVFSFFLFLRKKVDAQETMKVEKKIKNEKQRRPEEPVEPRVGGGNEDIRFDYVLDLLIKYHQPSTLLHSLPKFSQCCLLRARSIK